MASDFELTLIEDTTKTLFADFVDENGLPVDPVVVALVILEPDANVVPKTKAAVDLDNPSVGRWEFKFKFDQAGRYTGSWFGETTSSDSSIAKTFEVEASDRPGV